MQKDDFYSKTSLHDHAGVNFNVNGCSPKIDKDIFEEPGNQRVFVDHEVLKKMIFIQSHGHMAMQGRILFLRIAAQKSMKTFLRSPKIDRYSKVVFLSKMYYLKLKGTFQ